MPSYTLYAVQRFFVFKNSQVVCLIGNFVTLPLPSTRKTINAFIRNFFMKNHRSHQNLVKHLRCKFLVKYLTTISHQLFLQKALFQMFGKATIMLSIWIYMPHTAEFSQARKEISIIFTLLARNKFFNCWLLFTGNFSVLFD